MLPLIVVAFNSDAPFHPRPAPFIALALAGFVVAVIGHLFQSRLVVVMGITMVFAATVVVPLFLYLSTR
ncbi:MAG: hypothetical protein NVSMB25_20970 [Thermoleophilaceae bacterium]